jgi:hypothetical protein
VLRQAASSRARSASAAKGSLPLHFDYRHWGGSSGEPREVTSIPRQREDYRTTINWVAANPDIDTKGIVTLPGEERADSKGYRFSSGCDDLAPRAHRRGPEHAV